MKPILNVIWSEGTLLTQHYFQQWDRFQEQSHRLRTRMQSGLLWGLVELTIDEASLENGIFRILKLQWLLPNGRLVLFSEESSKSLTFDLLKQKKESYDLYCCLPLNEQVSGISGYLNKDQLTSGYADYVDVADRYDTDRVSEVMLEQPNLILLSGEEAKDQFYSIKIAQLLRVGEHQYECDKKFVPTVVLANASGILLDSLRRIIETIEAKITVLNERRRSFSGDVTEFGQSDLAHFLLLEALQTELPELQHYYTQQSVHPEKIYLSVSRLIGRLKAFHEAVDDVKTINYDHENLTKTFSTIEYLLNNLMNVVLPTRVIKINLDRETSVLYAANGIDSAYLESHTFFIAVYMVAADTSWIDRFAQHIKVGSRQQIESIVASALPGVKITHTQRPPSKLPVRSGYEYFRIDPYGPYWTRVQADRSLALFVSQEFEQAKIDLVTVKE